MVSTPIDAILSAGQRLLDQGRNDLASQQFLRVLSTAPEHPEALAMLALTRLRQNQHRAARELSLQAIQAGPESAYAYHIAAIIATHFSSADVSNQFELNKLFKTTRFDSKGRYNEARELLAESMRLDPYWPANYALLAELEMWQELPHAALAAADKGLEIDPQDSDLLNWRARALEQIGKTEVSMQSTALALEANPEDAMALNMRGWQQLLLRHPDQARQSFLDSLRIDPSKQMPKWGLTQCKWAKFIPYRWLLSMWLKGFLGVSAEVITLGVIVAFAAMGYARGSKMDVADTAWTVALALMVWLVPTWLLYKRIKAMNFSGNRR
jgi:tetratricopeptide (TPR) repeat protein